MIEDFAQLDYSRLYREYDRDRRKPDAKDILLDHPFYFIEDLLKKERSEKYLRHFTYGNQSYLALKDHQIYAYRMFEYEYALLGDSKTFYLNQLVAKLINALNRIKIIAKKKHADNDYLALLNSVTRDIIKDIFISYHLDLDNQNRKFLSKWFYLREPVTSFRFSHYPDDKRHKELFRKYLIERKFISRSTSFDTFKSLFEGRLLVGKVDWIDQKSSLYYFIKLLRKYNVIRNTKNKHWLIASEFFLLKGEILIPKDFLNQKETQNIEKREPLEHYVKALAQLNS